jgi:hypothetical protein
MQILPVKYSLAINLKPPKVAAKQKEKFSQKRDIQITKTRNPTFRLCRTLDHVHHVPCSNATASLLVFRTDIIDPEFLASNYQCFHSSLESQIAFFATGNGCRSKHKSNPANRRWRRGKLTSIDRASIH